MIAGKIWGHTMKIFSHNNVEIHRIEIKKGAYCSKHRHDFKYNVFYVEAGLLLIKVWKKDYKLCDETILKRGETTNVKPGEYHQFNAAMDTIAYEIYYTETLDNDIVRESVGGKE